MTEREWRLCVHPQPMLDQFSGAPSERKRRLFGCAACRRIWELMSDTRCQEAIKASEQFADNLISERELDLLSAAAEEAFEDAAAENDEITMCVAGAASYASSPSLASHVLGYAIESILPVSPEGTVRERSAQADLLRDIFGNP